MATLSKSCEVISITKNKNKLESVTLKIDSQNRTFLISDDMQNEALRDFLGLMMESLGQSLIPHQIELIKILTDLDTLFRGYPAKLDILHYAISKSEIHEFAADVINRSVKVSEDEFTSTQNELSLVVMNFCIDMTCSISKFVQNLWSTNTIENIVITFENPQLHRGNIDHSQFRNDCLAFIWNIIWRSTPDQRDLLSSQRLINALVLFRRECNNKLFLLIVEFLLAILIDGDQILLIEVENETLNYACQLIEKAWENNLRISEGVLQLSELLNGLYYLLRSDKNKLSFLEEKRMDLILEIITLNNSHEEIIPAIAIIKQLTRSQQAKLKLVHNYDLVTRLNESLGAKNYISNMKTMVEDIIQRLLI